VPVLPVVPLATAVQVAEPIDCRYSVTRAFASGAPATVSRPVTRTADP